MKPSMTRLVAALMAAESDPLNEKDAKKIAKGCCPGADSNRPTIAGIRAHRKLKQRDDLDTIIARATGAEEIPAKDTEVPPAAAEERRAEGAGGEGGGEGGDNNDDEGRDDEDDEDLDEGNSGREGNQPGAGDEPADEEVRRDEGDDDGTQQSQSSAG